MTNAEKLRQMTDEELATWLNMMQSNAWHSGEFHKLPTVFPSNNQSWLNWLESEVTND